MKRVRKVRVHWPITSGTFSRLAGGDANALRDDPGVGTLLRALDQAPELGDFGNYRQVFESGLGFEGFTCSEGSNPTLGQVGERTFSPTFVFTTYFDASLDDGSVEALMRCLVEIHPWEVPVIEVSGPVSVSSMATPLAEAGKAAS